MIDTSTYRNLVHKTIQPYRNKGIDYEELYGIGIVGLQEAAVKHDPTRGALGTIAPLYIRSNVRDALLKNKVYFNTYARATNIDIDSGTYLDTGLPASLSPTERSSLSTPEEQSPENIVLALLDGEKVKTAVDKLKDTRKYVILERYFNEGLASQRTTIAKAMGISQQRVAEIEQQALRDLKQLLGLS